MSTYISSNASGVPAGLIYTSEAQRKVLTAKMKRLWRKDRPKHKGSSNSNSGCNNNNNNISDNNENVEVSAQKGGSSEERQQEQGASSDGGRSVAIAGRSPPLDGCGGDDGGRIDGGDGGDGGDGSSDCDGEMMGGIEDEEGCQAVDRCALSRSLFDEILDQNAIPTIRQNSELGCGRFGAAQFGLLRSVSEFVFVSPRPHQKLYARSQGYLQVDARATPVEIFLKGLQSHTHTCARLALPLYSPSAAAPIQSCQSSFRVATTSSF